jgi:hypothetical protein
VLRLLQLVSITFNQNHVCIWLGFPSGGATEIDVVIPKNLGFCFLYVCICDDSTSRKMGGII